jgi:cell division protein ZapA
MSHVTVTIAEKVYRIACDDGQEEHLRRLAAEVDAKIAEMRTTFGEIGDNRLTVMAAITFLDQREEMKGRMASMQQEIDSLRAERVELAESLGRTEQEISEAIVEAANRIEGVARQLVPPPAG